MRPRLSFAFVALIATFASLPADAQMSPAAVSRSRVAAAKSGSGQVVPLQVELIRRADRYITVGAAIGAAAGLTYALASDDSRVLSLPFTLILFGGGGFAAGALSGLVVYAVTHPM